MGRGKVGVIYARVSSKTQAEEGYSLPTQIEVLTKIAEKEGITILEVLKDEGKSGRNFNRINLEKILRLAEEAKISHLLVIEIDRIGRDSIENLYYIKLLKECGVKIRTKSEEIDLNNISDLITATIKSLASQIEITSLSERTQRGKVEKWKNKKWVRSGIPFGYEKDNEWLKKIFQYDSLIKDLHKLFEKTNVYSKVCTTINKKYKKLLNKPLTIAQVKRILRDPVYIGKPRYGEEIVDSSELRFIDADTFSRTQKIMKRIKKRSSGDKNKKIVAIESIIDRFGICYAEKRFKIGVLCPVCGKVMVKNGMRQIRRSGVWVYNYLCQACRKQVRIPSGKQLAQLDRDVGKEPITSKNFFKAP